MVPFPLPMLEAGDKFFLMWNPGKAPRDKSYKTVNLPLHDWSPWSCLTVRVVHTEPSAICQLPFRFPCSRTSSCSEVCSWVSALVSPHSFFSLICLCNFGSTYLPYVLLSLKNPRRAVDSSSCSAFHLLLGWSGNLQVPYMKTWKSVCIINFGTRNFKTRLKCNIMRE